MDLSTIEKPDVAFSKDKAAKPLISVLTPVCNTGKYLEQCIKSLLDQTFKDFEVIALDDGSTDGSSEILDKLADADPRIRVIHKDNSGYGDTMNLGIRLSRGKYIAILESDDYAEPNMLKLLYKNAESADAELILANYYIDYVDTDGLSLIRTEAVDNLAKVPYDTVLAEDDRKKLAYTTPALWRCLYKKDFLLRERIFFLATPGAAFQDTSFFIKAVMMAQKAVHISDRILHYRRGQGTASVKDVSKIYCICDELDEIISYIIEKNRHSWFAIVPFILYIKYLWNYNRLAEPAKSEFMQRFKADMIAVDLNGWLQPAIWLENRYSQMEKLLNYGEIKPLNIRKVTSMNMNQRIKLNHFMSQLLLHDEIILYGAGTYGDLILQRMYDWHLYKKVRFAVTDEPEESIHKGIDVISIQSLKNCTVDYVVVIAAGEALTPEMVSVLNQIGITQYISLDRELRDALKIDINQQETSQIELLKESLKNERQQTDFIKKTLDSERQQTDFIKKTLDSEREQTKILKDSLNKEKEQVTLLNSMFDRMRNENELLRESYMSINQLEKRLDKLETLVRTTEVNRMNIEKILDLLKTQ